MNVLIFFLVALSLFSITTYTSYALFTNETEGQNTLSLTVSTAGKISIRILAQNDGTEVGTLSNHQNIIKFNVKDGYVYKDGSLHCTTDGEATYNKATNILTINNATQNGICEINYVAGYRKLYDIITSETLTKTDDGLAITTETNSGKPSYYYRGNVNNNYVKFANQTWRIIRTNEDNTIRIILEGGINNNATFYFNKNNYKAVQDMYYSNSDVTDGAKKTLNDWYQTNLKAYESQIATNEFCEEAKAKLSDVYTTGNATTVVLNENYIPNFKCKVDGNGKGILKEKIGLITIDELKMVGIPLHLLTNQVVNKDTYLQKNYNWWTMSPVGFLTSYNLTDIYYVLSDGYARGIAGVGEWQLRPVISLNSDVTAKGNGTSTSPYEIII